MKRPHLFVACQLASSQRLVIEWDISSICLCLIMELISHHHQLLMS